MPEPAGDLPEAVRALAGYVDLRHHPGIAADGCIELVRREVTETPRREWVELAPAGATSLTLDGRPLAVVRGDLQAVLGAGVSFPVELAAGDHRWNLTTCPERGEEGRFGFYLYRSSSPL